MYYVELYEKYPIYEPAEGGYYYTGSQYVEGVSLKTMKSARKFLKQEARKRGWERVTFKHPMGEFRPTIYGDKDYCYSKYIGRGSFLIMHKTFKGEQKSYTPYC